MSKARIIEAVKNLDLETTTKLLDEKSSLLTVRNRQGRNLLHLACSASCECWKRFDAARFLVLRGADVNFRDRKRKTALHHGVEKEFEPASLKRDQRFLAALS